MGERQTVTTGPTNDLFPTEPSAHFKWWVSFITSIKMSVLHQYITTQCSFTLNDKDSLILHRETKACYITK